MAAGRKPMYGLLLKPAGTASESSEWPLPAAGAPPRGQWHSASDDIGPVAPKHLQSAQQMQNIMLSSR